LGSPHWSDGRPCLARREAARAPSEANNWAQVRPSPRFGLNSRPRTRKSAARVSCGLFATVDKRCTGLRRLLGTPCVAATCLDDLRISASFAPQAYAELLPGPRIRASPVCQRSIPWPVARRASRQVIAPRHALGDFEAVPIGCSHQLDLRSALLGCGFGSLRKTWQGRRSCT
jgi:hypothetical protein